MVNVTLVDCDDDAGCNWYLEVTDDYTNLRARVDPFDLIRLAGLIYQITTPPMQQMLAGDLGIQPECDFKHCHYPEGCMKAGYCVTPF